MGKNNSAEEQVVEEAGTTEASNQPILSQEDLNHLKERIRSEERAKLQDKLGKASQLEQERQEWLQEKETLKKDKEALSANLDSLKKSVHSESGTVDIPRLINEVTEKTSLQIAENTKGRMQELERSVAAMQEENSRLKIESYKSRRVSESKDKGEKFITELVSGKTEEEIEASLLKAKDAYKQYFAGITPAQPVRAVTSNGPSPVVEPAAQSQSHAAPAAAPESGKEGVQNIITKLATPKGRRDYAENREALLEAAAEEAAEANLLVS